MSIVEPRVLRCCVPALLLAFAFTLSPRVAHAGDKALAESLFEAGRSLMQQKKFTEACPKFEESQRQDPSPGTLLNLGECYEGLGKTASAWAEYKAAATMAQTMGRSAQEKAALERAARLEKTLSKLEIDGPPSTIAGLTVKRDGDDIGVGSLGVALAVDPGDHQIEVSAPGYKTWSTKITVGKQATQKVSIPALEQAPESAPAAPAAATSAPPTHDQGVATTGSKRTIGYVVGGVGIVGIGVGTVFGLMASSQASSAKDDPSLCPGKVCTPAGRSEIDSAKSKALISTIGIGVGAAALITGAVLVLTSGSGSTTAPANSAALHVTPALGPGVACVSLTGGFE